MNTMATTTSTGLFIPARSGADSFAPSHAIPGAAAKRRRQITREAGHALEILGHAIEYLTDEYVHEGGALSANDSRVMAVQLLMALNREVYFGCPEVPSFGERCMAMLGVRG